MRAPLTVPGGTVTVLLPVSVRTSIDAPRTAWWMPIETSVNTS